MREAHDTASFRGIIWVSFSHRIIPAGTVLYIDPEPFIKQGTPMHHILTDFGSMEKIWQLKPSRPTQSFEELFLNVQRTIEQHAIDGNVYLGASFFHRAASPNSRITRLENQTLVVTAMVDIARGSTITVPDYDLISEQNLPTLADIFARKASARKQVVELAECISASSSEMLQRFCAIRRVVLLITLEEMMLTASGERQEPLVTKASRLLSTIHPADERKQWVMSHLLT